MGRGRKGPRPEVDGVNAPFPILRQHTFVIQGTPLLINASHQKMFVIWQTFNFVDRPTILGGPEGRKPGMFVSWLSAVFLELPVPLEVWKLSEILKSQQNPVVCGKAARLQNSGQSSLESPVPDLWMPCDSWTTDWTFSLPILTYCSLLQPSSCNHNHFHKTRWLVPLPEVHMKSCLFSHFFSTTLILTS